MRRSTLPVLLALAIGATSPALADSRSDSADARVAQTQKALILAQQSGDSASIADAQSKHEAAKAVAWGVRHPARQPMMEVAARK